MPLPLVVLLAVPRPNDPAYQAGVRHLQQLQQEGLVRFWHARAPGDPPTVLLARVREASVVVVAVEVELSAGTGDEDYWAAMLAARAREGEGVRVLEVQLRACLRTGFEGRSVLFRDCPIAAQASPDVAWASVAHRVRRFVRRVPPLEGEALQHYLGRIERQHGTIRLGGLDSAPDRRPIDVDRIYVSLDAARHDAACTGLLDRQEKQSHLGQLAARLDAKDLGPLDDPTRQLLQKALSEMGYLPADMGDSLTLAETWARLGRDRPEGAEALQALLRRQPFDSIVRSTERLLIEGDPGAGKTTLLQHVALALAHALRPDEGGDRPRREEAARAMGFAPPYPLPVFLHLRQLPTLVSTSPVTVGAAALEQALLTLTGSLPGGWLSEALEDGEVVLLFDGLDEISDRGAREQCAAMIRALLDRHPRCRVLLTSRPAGLSPEARQALSDGGGLREAQVLPLDDRQIQAFVRAWYAALVPDPEEAAREAQTLLAVLPGHDALLRRTPVLLTAMCIVHRAHRGLPRFRAALFDACVRALAHRRDEDKTRQDPLRSSALIASLPGPWQVLPEDTKIELLQAAALRLQLSGVESLSEGALGALLTERLGRHGQALGIAAGEALVRDMIDRSGILVPEGERGFRFRHAQFRELLSGQAILAWHRKDLQAAVAAWGKGLSVPKGLPLSTALLALGLLRWPEVSALSVLWYALRLPGPAVDLLETLGGWAAALADPGQAAEALAVVAGVLVDLGAYKVPREGVADGVAERICAIVGDVAQPGSEKARVAIAGALSLCSGGDPRLGEENRWVEVAGGPFWRGRASQDAVTTWDDELPAGWVTVGDFKIQRWAVTVEEYGRFVGEGRGYEEKGWWSEEGFRWRGERKIVGPDRWGAQVDGAGNVAVTGVCGWEAEAYCAWLTRKSRGLPSGWVVRMPTEAEWEKAARGSKDQRVYAWEGAWDPKKANVDRRIGRACSVGCFPAGHGPLGIWDMTGNVWEWCLDWFDPKAYARPLREDPRVLDPAGVLELRTYENDGNIVNARCRALRGGGWLGGAQFARVSDRNWYGPWRRGDNLGFRCVAAPPLVP